MRIFLVRHGESEGNVDTSVYKTKADHAIELSSRGHEQAHSVGRFLTNWFNLERDTHMRHEKAWMPPRLWVSPYMRTRQTADGIESAMGPQGLIRDRKEHILLCEQQFGLFDGIPDEDLFQRFPDEAEHYKKCVRWEGEFWARMPLGESRFDVAQRVHQAFGTFHRDRDKQGIEDIIVVAHGTTIRAFLMMWCHYPVDWFEQEPNPANCSIRLIEDKVDHGYIYGGG